MDLFEILQSDSQLTSNLIAEISFLQQTFSTFKTLIEPLSTLQELPKGLLDSSLKSLQNHVQTPMITPLLLAHFKETLDFLIFHQYFPEFTVLLSSSRIYEAIEYLLKVYETSQKFTISIITALIPNENTLSMHIKERFRMIFIQKEGKMSFINAIEGVISQDFHRFQKLLIETYAQKFDAAFFSQVLLHLSKNKPIETNSLPSQNILPSIFEICYEFEVLEDLQNLLIKLINADLLDFLRSDLENFDNYETNNLLNNAYSYAQDFLLSYLQFLGNAGVKPAILEIFKLVYEKIEVSIAEDFCIICKDRVFDMILAYPESEKLLFDLKDAIQKANFLYEIGDILLICINKRLLIPGVITQSILNQYINILKVLQLLDKGLIFSKITTPIKAYLLKRPDTLRCIIAHLTEDSENYTKLVKEYVKIPSKEEQQYELSSDEDEASAEKWEVLPLLSKKNSLIRVKYQESDLVSVLVNLYGSQEAFINEYQIMLAEKLLGAKEFNIEEEIKNIELLKLRFGENNLQSCNIIVKDVKESKRIDQNLHANFDNNIAYKRGGQELLSFDKLHAMFASKGYWPINYECENTVKLPAGLSQVFEEYSAKYSKIKAIRKLIWHNQLGFVNLSLTFDNGEYEFKCLPIHAILISYLDETSNFIDFI